MKKIKLLLVALTFSLVGFISCTDTNPIENQVETKSSISLRTTLNEIKKVSGIGNRLVSNSQDQALCFDFVYPISLSYNNGTVVSVSTFEGLLEILSSENQNLYVEGIGFPFEVQQEGVLTTIGTEDEFNLLLDGCDFYTADESIYVFDCYEVVYPFSIVNQDNETVVIANESELYMLFASPNSNQEDYIVAFVYPLTFTQNGQSVSVNDLYGLLELLATCSTTSDCVCTLEYAPVCVQTANGIVEYTNFCFAQCNGFTQNDLVSCGTVCEISNLTVSAGACNSDGTYSLTIDFDFVSAPSIQFEVYNGSGDLVGNYLLSDLPYTITNYVGVAASADYLTVKLSSNSDCEATQQWAVPDCNGTPLNFNQLLGACFEMQYPLQVQYQGGLVTVNNDGELLQYQTVISEIPAINYPVNVLFASANPTYTTVNSQAAFEGLINSHCF